MAYEAARARSPHESEPLSWEQRVSACAITPSQRKAAPRRLNARWHVVQGQQLHKKEYDELVTHMLERAMADELQAEGASLLCSLALFASLAACGHHQPIVPSILWFLMLIEYHQRYAHHPLTAPVNYLRSARLQTAGSLSRTHTLPPTASKPSRHTTWHQPPLRRGGAAGGARGGAEVGGGGGRGHAGAAARGGPAVPRVQAARAAAEPPRHLLRLRRRAPGDAARGLHAGRTRRLRPRSRVLAQRISCTSTVVEHGRDAMWGGGGGVCGCAAHARAAGGCVGRAYGRRVRCGASVLPAGMLRSSRCAVPRVRRVSALACGYVRRRTTQYTCLRV
jgi:hypothetical protein